MSPPIQNVRSDATLPAAPDVVIIGAGMAGTTVAYALAKKGHSVALLDKGYVAGEQSSRNWGWCRQQHRDLRELPLAQRSIVIWEGLSKELGTDVSFRRTGLLFVTTKQADLDMWERWTNRAREYQVRSHILTAAEARAMTRGSTVDWIGGVHSPSDGRAEPAIAVPALAEGARRLGVSIHQNCAARGLEMEAGRVAGVVTEKGSIRTRAVLCAGGAWTSLFCRHHGLKLPQAGVRSTSFLTHEAPQVIEGGVSMSDVTFRRRLDCGYTVGLSGRGLLEVTPRDFFIRDSSGEHSRRCAWACAALARSIPLCLRSKWPIAGAG
jgi:glycine/D-amino acid oxidase-like deaminating enzyme